MNYYKQFAEMLGLELEQEFVLTDADGNRKNKYTYKFTEDGLVYKSPTFTNWAIHSLGNIGIILNGDVKTVPKPWKPENGDRYWYYSEAWDEENCVMWKGEFSDLLLWKVGNCFRTEKEASTKGKEVMETIHKEYEEA